MTANPIGAAITATSKSWKWHVAGPGCACGTKQIIMIRCPCCVCVLDLHGHNRAIHVPTKFICCDEANLAWFFIKISKMINHLKLQLRPLGPPSEIAVHIKLCACIKGECYSQNPRLRMIITCVCRISSQPVLSYT